MEEHQQKLMYLFWPLSMWSEDDIWLLCRLVHGIIVSEDIYLCFHGTKPAGLSETLMPIYWTTQQHGVFCDSGG